MKVDKEVFAFDHAVEKEAGDVIANLLFDMLFLCMGGVGS